MSTIDKPKYKFVISGGHHNSALVVARLLQSRGHQVEWVGHRLAAHQDRHDSAEYIEVTASKIPFHNLVAGKSSWHPHNLVRIPAGFLGAYKLIKRIRPDAVISFGGYLGLAVAVAAKFLRLPIFIHEQTVIAGKANKFVAKIATQVFLTWESSRGYYHNKRIKVVGLPLRPGFINAQPRSLFTDHLPTLFVMGGKQGSHSINKLIFAHLTDILRDFNLIHQTGTSSATGDYEHAMALQEALPAELADRYEPRGYIGEDEIASIMQAADLYIGRSGAHTTYELAVLGKRAILIPLLSTHGQEQLKNAQLLANAGNGLIIKPYDLTYPHLRAMIEKVLMQKPHNIPVPHDAAQVMIKAIFQDLEASHVAN